MTTPASQYVRFLFVRLDPAWRRLAPDVQRRHKQELGDTVLRFHARLLLRTYSLSGTRGDADLLFWQVADDLELFQGLQTAIFSTGLGGYLRIAYSYLGVARRSVYEFPQDTERDETVRVRPQDAHYLFVYPFVKSRPWYALPFEARQAMMEEHIRIGRKYTNVSLNTVYCFGLDDQEFVVAFEGDDPSEFVSLVLELRESKASAYTLRDTPMFTCIQMSLWDALDSMGGAGLEGSGLPPDTVDGFVGVAHRTDLPEGRSLRVYHGASAIALFHVRGHIYAIDDRCPHGRASLSEGTIDPERCQLTCPWHQGRFDLTSGQPCGGPVRSPVRTYEVRIDGDRILIR